MNASFVPLPNLDDRRWADLVDEGRSLIPVYAPSWTDHNAHDPGITLMELLAWIAETDIYRADRIPASHYRAFLALIGTALRPPVPARATVTFTLKPHAAAPVALPACALLRSAAGPFRLRSGISVLPSAIAALQVESAGKFRDATTDWLRGRPIALFGHDPKPGDSFYLGFDPQLGGGTTLSLFFQIDGAAANAAERRRILDEIAARDAFCSQMTATGCEAARPPAQSPELPPHHSARILWEVQTASGIWQAIDAHDDTRSLTLSSTVTLTLPQPVAMVSWGAVARSFAYLRARFVSGSYDAAPVALRIDTNAVEAEQCAPIGEDWTIAAGVIAEGEPPSPGEFVWLRVDFLASGEVSKLEFGAAPDNAMLVRVLLYKAARGADTGTLRVEARRVGTGSGAPNQTCNLPGPQQPEDGFTLYTVELGQLRPWRQRANFLTSGPADADVVRDLGSATVCFGDGQNGLVPPEGATIVATALSTAGAAGNVDAGAITALDIGPYNTSLLGDPKTIASRLQLINPLPAHDGTDEETLAHAQGRAAALLQAPSRTVTLDDCETLARQVPGTAVARATAVANHHPALPCYSAPGMTTVVIVPYLPLGRPEPSAGLLNAVSGYLAHRHVIGTRIEVMGPDYLEVGVNARVKTAHGQNKTAVRDAIAAALREFLDPLAGGPDGTGWPLGRDVYTSEVLDVIARIPGVDHVLSLKLVVAGFGAQCGNVCLPRLALTVSGAHQIEVS